MLRRKNKAKNFGTAKTGLLRLKKQGDSEAGKHNLRSETADGRDEEKILKPPQKKMTHQRIMELAADSLSEK